MKKRLLGRLMKVLAIIVIITSAGSISSQVQAADIGSIISAGNSWIGQGAAGGESVDTFVDDFIVIGQILVSIGIAAILIVTAIIAAKWIVATPDQQAKLRQQLIGLIVSIIVIFGAVGIWNLVRNMGENFF